MLVYNNIVYNTLAAAFYQHFGQNNSITNNIFAFADGGYGTLWHDADPSFGPSTFAFQRNIVLMDARAGGVFECPYVGSSNFDFNLYFNASQPSGLTASFPTNQTPGHCRATFADWQQTGQV